MSTVFNTTKERSPIDSIDRNLPILLELLCLSPNGAAYPFFFYSYKNVGSLLSQVSTAKRKTFFLFPSQLL